MLDIEPLETLRRLAAATARAVRIAERQTHLVGEIGAQEIDEVGAVGTQAGACVVFAAAQMVEQEIARLVVQHLVPCLPRQVLIDRRREQLFDPRREQRLRRAVPAAAHLPDVSRRNGDERRPAPADGDVAGDRAAVGGSGLGGQRGAPCSPGRRGDLREPDIGRPALPVGRSGRDASIRRDQRERAVHRLFNHDRDPQRRAAPWRSRRRQHDRFGCVLAGGGCRGLDLGLGLREDRSDGQTRDQQPCCNNSQPACMTHLR